MNVNMVLGDGGVASYVLVTGSQGFGNQIHATCGRAGIGAVAFAELEDWILHKNRVGRIGFGKKEAECRQKWNATKEGEEGHKEVVWNEKERQSSRSPDIPSRGDGRGAQLCKRDERQINELAVARP